MRRYGLLRPFDFARAIPFVTALVLLVVVLIAAGVFVVGGRVHWPSFRADYFVYLVGLACLAALVSVRPVIAWSFIALCFVDLLLGMTIHAVLPADIGGGTFRYHPLLQGVPTPNYKSQAATRALSPDGGVEHDRYGLRGENRTLDARTVIATFGGSTTYDLGVQNNQTWPAALERKLGPGYAVLNHGVPGYTTVENLIQTAFYMNAYDVTPRCAIYYEGWNDIRNAHVPDLDPAYANFHLPSEAGVLRVRRMPFVARISPVALVLVSYLRAAIDTVPTPPTFADQAPKEGSDPRLEAIYRSNLRTIAAINRDRGIATIFVGQMLNREKLSAPPSHDDLLRQWVPLVPRDAIWSLQERFNTILTETAQAAHVAAFVPPIDRFTDADFVDSGHFSPSGADRFASLLVPVVQANCARGHAAARP